MNDLMNNLTNPGLIPLTGSDLLKCKGYDAATNFKTNPNCRLTVFDTDDDVFYLIKTDGANNKEYVTRYRFYEDPIPKPEDLYASKDDLKELKGEMADVKQSIQELVRELKKSDNTSRSVEHHNSAVANVGGKPEPRPSDRNIGKK